MSKSIDYLRGFSEGVMFAVSESRNDKPAREAAPSIARKRLRRGRKPGSKIVNGKVVQPTG